MKEKACMYLRLSRDDGVDVESNSISSQRELIKNYAKSNNIHVDYEYVDDGISGATFERPSFKKMIKDLSKGRIKTIIVKDLSRFGRDYIEAGRYIQKIFPEMKVRFISINDNYDSKNADTNDTHLILPIRNFINDSYCRDISMKVKSSQKMKRLKGEFIGAFAPFGYKKDKKDKHKLIIDKKVSGIVQKIFSMKLEGYSSNAIAKHLNDVGAITPAKHKESNGKEVGFIGKKNQWDTKMINRIITNRIYIGILEQGKQVKLNYKSSKRVDVSKEDWVVIENAHPAIVSESMFQIANSLLLRDVSSRGKPNVLSGMLFCADCGSQLIKRLVKYKNKKTVHYICGHYNDTGECSRHSIKEEDILSILQILIKDFLAYNEKLLKKLQYFDTSQMRFEMEYEDLIKEKKKYETLRQSLFMDLADDLINEEEFQRFRNSYAMKIHEIEKQIETKQAICNQIKEKIINKQWLLDVEIGRGKELDRMTLVYLIDRVNVDENKEITLIFHAHDKLQILEKIITGYEKAIDTEKGKVIQLPLPKEKTKEVAVNG